MTNLASCLKAIAERDTGENASVIMLAALKIEELEFNNKRLANSIDKDVEIKQAFIKSAGLNDNISFDLACQMVLHQAKKSLGPDDLLCIKDICMHYKISRSKVYAMRKSNAWPVKDMVLGDSPRWFRKTIDRFVAKRG